VFEGQKNLAMLQAIPQNIKGLAPEKTKRKSQIEAEVPSQQTILELSTDVAQSATKGDKEEFTLV
jgi:hypothetical protein